MAGLLVDSFFFVGGCDLNRETHVGIKMCKRDAFDWLRNKNLKNKEDVETVQQRRWWKAINQWPRTGAVRLCKESSYLHARSMCVFQLVDAFKEKFGAEQKKKRD